LVEGDSEYSGLVGVGQDRWFASYVSRRVGDGADISFWSDVWCEGMSFSDRFRHTYDLVVKKSIMARDIFLSGWEVGGEAWSWSRRLWVWEEELLDECRALLLTVHLQGSISDVLQWHLDPV